MDAEGRAFFSSPRIPVARFTWASVVPTTSSRSSNFVWTTERKLTHQPFENLSASLSEKGYLLFKRGRKKKREREIAGTRSKAHYESLLKL